MDSVTLSPQSRSEAASPRAMLYRGSFGRVRVKRKLFRHTPTRLLRATSDTSFETSLSPSFLSSKSKKLHPVNHKHMTLRHLQLDSSLLSDSASSSSSSSDEEEKQKKGEGSPHPRDFLEELIQKYAVKGQSSLIDLASRGRLMRPVEVFWEKKHGTGFIPSAREGATLTLINHKLYLFGGESRTLFNDVMILSPEQWRWEAPPCSSNSDPPPEPRSGHSTVQFKNCLVVFGGGGAFNPTLKLRKCYNRVHVFDTSETYTVKNTWRTASPYGCVPSVRRNHAASLIGCTLLVYGGQDEQGSPLDDLSALDLETMRWFQPKIHKTSGARPGKRHSMSFVAVFGTALMRMFEFDVFHVPGGHEDSFTRTTSGFYLFGGLTRSGKASNELFILKPKPVDSKDDDFYMRWVQPEVAGTPPEPRYGYTASMIGKYVAYCGGRNDSHRSGGLEVKDIALLNVESMRWETVSSYGLSPPKSWGSCSSVVHTKLIIFGGMRTDSYCSGKLLMAETDPATILEEREELRYIQGVKELMGRRAFERVTKATMISSRRVLREAGEAVVEMPNFEGD